MYRRPIELLKGGRRPPLAFALDHMGFSAAPDKPSEAAAATS